MIYVVTHKRLQLPTVDGCQPIQVGSAPEDFPGCLRDNTGDNIAEKNANYCELTALYWAWKNSSEPYKGLAHYRRYFGRRRFSSAAKDILPETELRSMLESADIILAKPSVYHVNVREELLIKCCTPEIFGKLRATVAELSPDSIAAFDTFFAGNRASQYNMLYCERAIFDSYCEWLFPILFALEAQVDLSGMDAYRQRLYGFLSERLLNVWVAWRGLRVRTVPVVSTDYSLRDHLTYFRRDITNGLRFALRGR